MKQTPLCLGRPRPGEIADSSRAARWRCARRSRSESPTGMGGYIGRHASAIDTSRDLSEAQRCRQRIPSRSHSLPVCPQHRSRLEDPCSPTAAIDGLTFSGSGTLEFLVSVASGAWKEILNAASERWRIPVDWLSFDMAVVAAISRIHRERRRPARHGAGFGKARGRP